MQKQNAELILLTAGKLLVPLGVACVIYLVAGSLFSRNSWPPKDEREEEQIIASYKQKLRMGDSPLSPRTAEDTVRYLGRIIDHEVKTGELKSGREYITQAIMQKIDGQVESVASKPESKALIAKVRSGVRKRDELIRLTSHYGHAPGEKAGKEARDKFDEELKTLSEQFCSLPFDPVACPELAEEMMATYKAKLEGMKGDPRLQSVIKAIERTCRPRQP